MELPDSNIELCVNYIEEGRCILFLGPQFALDTQNKKVHEELKKHLLEAGNFKEKIDFSYDNLFIFKDAKPRTGEKMRLNIELKKLYKAVKAHAVYQKIPFIPFSAIISCSPDHFLKQSFEDHELDLYFRYYSRKGVVEERGSFRKNTTLLYNVFGHIDQEDSLITTYESFYKFIISIMGEEQQLPLELRKRIVEAKIFIFMGFDLTKWYIPLLVHKLHSFKQEGGGDATAMISEDNTLNEKTEKHFPIEMMVLNGASISTIDAIHQKLTDNKTLRIVQQQNLADEIAQLKQKLAENDLPLVFELLRKCFQSRNMNTNEITATETRWHELQQKKRLGTISEAEIGLEKAKIVNTLLDLIDQLS